MHRLLHSLKFRIMALAVMTGVVAAGGTATLMLNVTAAEVQNLLLANDRQDRERMAALLSSKLETLKLGMKALAPLARQPLAAGRQGASTFLLEQPTLGALFDSVFLADATGRIEASIENGTPVLAVLNIADRAYFKQVMRSDQPVVSEPLLSKLRKNPVVIVAVPLLDEQGRTEGVLGGVLSLRSNTLFTDPTGMRADGVRDLVMDRAGTILFHNDRQRVLGNAEDESGLGAIFARWSAAGSPIDTVATAELSDDQLVSYAGIPLSDWVLVRLTPRAIAMSPLRGAEKAAWLAAATAGFAAALVAALLAWVAVRPITRLRDGALEMLAGKAAPTTNWSTGSDEVGEMARAFEQLFEQREGQRAASQNLLRQLQAVLDNAEVGIALTRNGRFEMVSEQFCAIFGLSREDAIGAPSRIMYPSDEAYSALSRRAEPSFIATGTFDGEVELARSNNSVFWAHMRGRALLPGDRRQGTIWVITDVTGAYRQREQLKYEAGHDALTGLANRAAFESVLEKATEHALDRPFCALFIDLDRFKQVNDQSGHAAGDALLRGLSVELERLLRKSDVVARLGGDEFAVLLPQCPLPRAQAIAQNLCLSIEAYRLDWEGRQHRVGASIGVVLADGRHATSADVMEAADRACYTAKRAGRNQVVVASAG